MNCSAGSLGANVVCTPWISELQKYLLLNPEVLRINQDVTPQGRPLKDGDLTLWARTLTPPTDDAPPQLAIALYNEGDKPISIGVSLADLVPLWGAASKVHVRDLWMRKDVGDFEGAIPPAEVAPHEAKLLGVVKVA